VDRSTRPLNAAVLALLLRRLRDQPRASVVPIEPG
jgi:hypothetical protein